MIWYDIAMMWYDVIWYDIMIWCDIMDDIMDMI